MRSNPSRSRRQLLGERARALRAVPTASEAALWRRLRAQQLGVRFRRQVPIGPYIADFMAPAARLVVEVDGAAHRGRAHLDARRERALSRLGYRVLRLTAQLVCERPELAVARIREALAG